MFGIRQDHTVEILKVSENYQNLLGGLQDICNEASKLKSVEINGIKYDIELFLGGDWKFLAIVCGLDSATSQHSCIWCKCPKSERWDMSCEWSITDSKEPELLRKLHRNQNCLNLISRNLIVAVHLSFPSYLSVL